MKQVIPFFSEERNSKSPEVKEPSANQFPERDPTSSHIPEKDPVPKSPPLKAPTDPEIQKKRRERTMSFYDEIFCPVIWGN